MANGCVGGGGVGSETNVANDEEKEGDSDFNFGVNITDEFSVDNKLLK